MALFPFRLDSVAGERRRLKGDAMLWIARDESSLLQRPYIITLGKPRGGKWIYKRPFRSIEMSPAEYARAIGIPLKPGERRKIPKAALRAAMEEEEDDGREDD